MNTNQIISARILANVKMGADLEAAIDAVLGKGAYAKMASELYNELRKAA